MHDDRRDPDPALDPASRPQRALDGDGGVGNDPLLPGERETYGTDATAGDGSEDAIPPGGTDARGWFAVGLVLLVIFIAILVWAVLAPLF